PDLGQHLGRRPVRARRRAGVHRPRLRHRLFREDRGVRQRNGQRGAIPALMFLSGTFFPLDAMPDFLRVVARALPLTYLSDALRQTMVNGAALFPLWVCLAVLAGWAVVCFGISARFFRWQ